MTPGIIIETYLLLLRSITQQLYMDPIPFANITQDYSPVEQFARAPHLTITCANVRG